MCGRPSSIRDGRERLGISELFRTEMISEGGSPWDGGSLPFVSLNCLRPVNEKTGDVLRGCFINYLRRIFGRQVLKWMKIKR